jgi:hypothetical protein
MHTNKRLCSKQRCAVDGRKILRLRTGVIRYSEDRYDYDDDVCDVRAFDLDADNYFMVTTCGKMGAEISLFAREEAHTK